MRRNRASGKSLLTVPGRPGIGYAGGVMEFRLCPDCHRAFASRTGCPKCGAALTLATPEYFLGEIFGKYRLESVLGAGGMGVVFLAEQSTLRRKVALKLILPQMDDPEFRRRFLREARVLAEIRHPNVVEIFDFEVNDWGLPFYVMEYLEGRTLRDLLMQTGPFALENLVPLMKQAASGLAGVHRRGIVHRDLKPANIFLARYDGGEVVKVLDFGIAKTTGTEDETRLTRSGSVVGTVNYLAPEQLLEEDISPAVDQYALALVFVELLTGKAVRAGKTMAGIISSEITRPVDLSPLGAFSPKLIEVVKTATMPLPRDRFPDIESFVDALESLGKEGSAVDPFEGGATLRVGEKPAAPRSEVPTVPQKKSKPGRLFHFPPEGLLIPALVFLLIFGGIWAFLRLNKHARSAVSSGNAVLELTRKISVPLDCSRIIGFHEELLMMAGMEDLVLQKLDSLHPPTRIGLSPDDIIGMVPDGGLLIHKGSRVELGDPAGQGFFPWAEGLPETGNPVFSEDARYLAQPSGKKLKIWKWKAGHYEAQADIRCGIKVRFVSPGSRLVVVAGDDTLEIYSMDERKLRYRGKQTEKIRTVAFSEDADLVALAGWFDSVRVINLKESSVEQIPRHPGADMKIDLQFLDEGATLAIGERGGVMLWRKDKGIIARWENPDALLTDLSAGSGRLLALDQGSNEVLFFSLGGITSMKQTRIADELPWAILADPATNRVFIGLENGILHTLSLDDYHSEEKQVHTQGITSLVGDGERIASASDDKTIAIWRLPELEVEWRSRAHDYLVNRLFFSPQEKHLWSTSSDGKIKKWSWPDLEELESIDIEQVFGASYPLHALWVSPDEKQLFVGTWARKADLLRRDASGGWEGTSFPFDSEAGYAIAGLPAVDSLLLLGANHPFELALYDFSQERFFRLSGKNRFYSSVLGLDQGRRALVFSENEILDFRFQRLEDDRLAYRFAITRHQDLGQAAIAVRLPEGRVGVVNAVGILHIISIEDINGPEICRVVLGGN